MENEDHKSNLNASEIDEETEQRLKGDAIGETMYSQSGILRTLLSLSDMKWSEDLEDELCFLWDSTIEKDVCDFLYTHKFPALVSALIEKHHDNNRFVEIMIGILGNELVTSDDSNKVSKEEILPVVEVLFKTADPLILIQVVRVLVALAYNKLTDPEVYMTDEIIDKLNFFLTSSNDEDLLLTTLDYFDRLGENHRIKEQYEKYLTGDFLQRIVVAFQTIVENVDTIESGPGKRALGCLCQLVTNCCDSIKNCEEKRQEFLPGMKAFFKEANKVLRYYSDVDDELILDDDYYLLSYFNGIGYVFVKMNMDYSKDLFINACIIYFRFGSGTVEFDDFLEMLAFLIYKGDFEEMKNDLDGAKVCRKLDPVGSLSLINHRIYDMDLHYDFPFEENLKRLLRSYSGQNLRGA